MPDIILLVEDGKVTEAVSPIPGIACRVIDLDHDEVSEMSTKRVDDPDQFTQEHTISWIIPDHEDVIYKANGEELCCDLCYEPHCPGRHDQNRCQYAPGMPHGTTVTDPLGALLEALNPVIGAIQVDGYELIPKGKPGAGKVHPFVRQFYAAYTLAKEDYEKKSGKERTHV